MKNFLLNLLQHRTMNEHYQNDPILDWDYEERKLRPLTLQQLENRLAMWKARQDSYYLELYRAAVSI